MAKVKYKDGEEWVELAEQKEVTALKEEFTTQRQQDQFKVATVEKGLNDYKSTLANVNVNQEVKQKISGYGVVSLPKTAANGQVSVSVKGNTRTNIVPQDITKWEQGSIATVDGVTTFSSITLRTKEFENIKGGATYVADLSSDFESAVLFEYASDNSYLGYKLISPKESFTTLTNTARYKIRINKTPVGTILPSDILNAKFIIEEGSTVGNYIIDTKSTISASRLKSVGKNLFDGKMICDNLKKQGVDYFNFSLVNGRPSLVAKNNNTNSTMTADGKVIFNKLVEGERYTLFSQGENVASSVMYFRFIYSDGTIESKAINSPITSTSGKNLKEIRLASTANGVPSIYLDTLQLEQSTVATPYEPYTESTSYLPNVGELRSLPNGVRDEVRVSGGKAELVQRVSDEVIINGGKVTEFIVSNNDVYRTIIYNINPSPLRDGYFVEKNNDTAYKRNIMALSEDRSIWILDGSRIQIYIEKTKIDNMVGTTLLDKFKAYLNLYPITLTYQLTNEIVTPIQTSGNLISYPSGTIYVENVVADAGNYTTKFDIKELQLPIKSIDKLIKYNFTTGVQTILDTSLAVINADKKSFTHPNLTDKDMVFVDYFYDVESTLGETTIEYLDSRHTIKDSVNNKFYKWDIKSANGVPTVELTEVL